MQLMSRYHCPTVLVALLLAGASVMVGVEHGYCADGQLVDPLSAGGVLKTVISLIAVCALAVLVLGRIAPRFHGSVLVAGKEQGAARGVKLNIVRRTVLSRENELVEVVTCAGERLLFSTGRGGVVFQGWFDERGRFYSEKLPNDAKKTPAEQEITQAGTLCSDGKKEESA
jgi:hypothetical protein